MINVDISNVWGQLSLPDLLALEADTAAAHARLTEGGFPTLPEAEPILKAAETIRRSCDACVVIGTDSICLGSRAAVELLQGTDRNLAGGKGVPQLFFAGNSLSSQHWLRLQRQLEGKDVCLIYASPNGTDLEPAIAFRGLRWMLERRYGTDEANRRIVTVAQPGTALAQMAAEEHWETFFLPTGSPEGWPVLTAAGLLPMAVAGIDIAQLLKGAADVQEVFSQGSFDSPVWLYAAVRSLMHRSGRTAELLETFEPDFQAFGRWWQQLFAASGQTGLQSIPTEVTANLYTQGRNNVFETILRFEPTGQTHIIGPEVKDLDQLNFLSGRTLDQLQEQVFFGALEAHTNRGVPVIAIDCEQINPRTIGQLLCFLLLSCSLSGHISEPDSFRRSDEATCRQELLHLLGKPENDT